MKKILSIVFVLTLSFYLMSCASLNQFEEGDFIYDKISGEAFIIDVSSAAKDKPYLVVPNTVNDLSVRIGRRTLYGSLYGSIKSDKVKRIYIFSDIEEHVGLEYQYVKSLEKIFCFYIQGISFDFEQSDVYQGTYGPSYNENFYPNNKNSFYANVSYHFNYDGAPDEGYYFIDDYDDELIGFIPEYPQREGYEFLGWFKDEETLIPWDFEVDRIPEKIYNDGVYQFVETKLYAKWGN